MTMTPQDKGGITYYTFANLSARPGIRHGVFARNTEFLEKNDMGIDPADDPSQVRRNRRMIEAVMGARPIFARQVHGTRILSVATGDAPSKDAPAPEGDAMITDVPGKLIGIQVADCQPVLLHDPEKRVVAGIHSGWRGSVANIIGLTVGEMVSRYGCTPGDIIAGIGPSLGPCCAEFIHYRKEIPEIYHSFKDSRDHFDFWAISRRQLEEAGVPPGQIEIGGICTKCRTDRFFSYRGEKARGRFVAVIGLA